MFGLGATTLALIVLAMLSAGGIAYALLFDRVQDEKTTEKRLTRLLDPGKVVEERATAGRRRSIQDAFKEFEAKQEALDKRNKKPPLAIRLSQAGLDWNRRTFLFFSIGLAVATGLLVLIISGNPLVAFGGGVIGFLGLPSWLVDKMRKRRQKAFLEELPTAVDLIVRGIRSGLPLGDCLRMVATETKEPVKGEFRQIIEAQHLGVPVGEACLKLYERMPVQEANFFGIVIAIQQKAGGNLSEALSNLSKVLRDRKRMKAKITAMSMEAKSSAAIIGSLPIVVAGLVYLTSPSYIMLLFKTNAGNVIVIGGLLYMLLGIMVMKKMIDFDF
ncbi:MAG: type II secretion system F family protein [Siculibacillus sp.]|nr:type II secretion system F family protein [Siculibacillus sp.]